MIRFVRAGFAALAFFAVALATGSASAHPVLVPIGHGPFWPSHFPGWHPRWGGFGIIVRPLVAYEDCYLRRFVDDDGDVVIRRVCD